MCNCQNTFWNGNGFTVATNNTATTNGGCNWLYGGTYQASVYVRLSALNNGTTGNSNGANGSNNSCGNCCGTCSCCHRRRCCGCHSCYNGCYNTTSLTNGASGYGCAQTYGVGGYGRNTGGCGYYYN
ncbi:MAG: hypothetical protein IJB97_06335 [Clostridia bacterium]|nr:hypothetical protein [Clostridia bacterium]